MRFEFFSLRFDFTARESIVFPPGKAANILRGALGTMLRRIACRTDCLDTHTCQTRASCPYARIFEPGAQGGGPSGLADWPRPFVFRARHLEGRRLRPGDAFCFHLHVFSLDPYLLRCFVLAFEALADEGIGPTRGKAILESVGGSAEPMSLDLCAGPAEIRKISVDFLSGTELKHDHQLVSRPEFHVLFARVRDRISTLRALYGLGPLDIDFQGSSTRAAEIRLNCCEIQHVDAERRSSRTGQVHTIGGFIGTAEYEGNLTEFLPYIEAAQWTGVGRQAVWGKGELRVRVLSAL